MKRPSSSRVASPLAMTWRWVDGDGRHQYHHQGGYTGSRLTRQATAPLDALFVETNPGPVKYAAWRLGLIGSPEARLPLAPVSEATKKAVDGALAQVGLLQAKAAE